jgi:hypothetical protein
MNDHGMSINRRARAGAFALLALWGATLSGCGAVDPGAETLADEPPRAEPQQLDPGTKVWRQVTLTFADGTPLATIYVFNRALGSYVTGHEYWYVNRSALVELGKSNLSIRATDESTTTPPSDPGYANEQRFVLNENVSWGAGWTTDPYSTGSLYTGADPSGNPLALRLFTSSSRITTVVWYQAGTDGGCSVCTNITPAGTFSMSSGAWTLPPGYVGHDIAQSTAG